tara:strand:- start:2696 stop:3121 length:426 start_codon:yes stop_codon:yes gene_type:complete
MKKLLYLITLVTSISFAQEGISYQAIAYDNNGFEMSSQEIQLQLSILGDSINGSAEYVESHTVTTDDFGLFYIVIGSGDTESNLSAVNWKSPKFLKVEMQNGEEMTTLGVSQFLSVPYSYYSQKSADTERLKTLMYLSNGF